MNNIVLNKSMYIILIIVFVILSFIIANQLFIIVLPFLFGYLISKLFIPIINKTTIKNTYIKGIFTFVLILLFISFVSLLLFLIGRSIINFLSNQVINNDTFRETILGYYNQLIDEDLILPFNFKLNIPSLLENGLRDSVNFIVEQSRTLVENSLRFIAFLPEILVFIIITFISAFFFTKDHILIQRKKEKYIGPYMPYLTENKYYKIIRNDILYVLGGYIKAQLILMTFTFIISSIALGIIQINNFILKAFIISFVDALPIFGTAIIIVPWSIFNFIQGNYFISIYLFSLYLLLTTFRQSIEPKVFSSQIGLYPLLTLFSIYAGLKLIGVLGIFIGPILVIVTKTLLKHKNTNV